MLVCRGTNMLDYSVLYLFMGNCSLRFKVLYYFVIS